MPKKKTPNSGPGTYGKAWGTRGVPGAMKAQGTEAGHGKFGAAGGRDLAEDGSQSNTGTRRLMKKASHMKDAFAYNKSIRHRRP